MTPKPHSALQAYEAGELDSGPFVINLCSSTTPMALVQPQAPELKRFTFFMSRRREDGRERFRLHMGYFVTAAEADEWLIVVREIFPGAWVGEAPGKRLRERQAAATAQAAAVVRSPAVTFAPPPRPAAAASQVQRNAAPASAARAPVQRQAAPVAPAPVRAAPAAPVPANVPTVHPARTAPQPPARSPQSAASNVREVLAELDRAPPKGRPVQPNVAAARTKPVQPNVAAQRAKAPVRPARPPAPARAGTPGRAMPPPPRAATPAVAAAAASNAASISDTQVLRILEQRVETPSQGRSEQDAHTAIALLKPEDTGTRRALREAVTENRPVAFAVQLQWSVQPIDLAKVPPLAIFSAYTLYTVEGSREGRRWYGLRLGFFSDAISAKQVAYYVRSEFATVAVVPVSTQERSSATEEKRNSPSLSRPIPVKDPGAYDFKLLDDEPRAAPTPQPQKPAAPAARPRAQPPRTGGRVQARAKARSETLEETLEILGASELEIDTGTGETLNDTGVRHLHVEVKKNTPFGRLLDALAERIKS